MKTYLSLVLLALIVAVCGSNAADHKPTQKHSSTVADQPDFAVGWRVTGVIKQGGRLQASVEKTALLSKFVHEGDELVSGIVVEKIDRDKRTVTIRRGTQTAVIRTAAAPPPAKTSTVVAQTEQPAKPQPHRGPPWSSGPSTAGQDENGRWGVRVADGSFFTVKDYVKRFGGMKNAIEHSNKHLAEDTDPNRRSFHEQMLSALQNANGVQ